MLIENLKQLNEFIASRCNNGYDCLLAIKDNKSDLTVQYAIVRHPIDFIRQLNDLSKRLHLPVSDMDILLFGFVSPKLGLVEVDDIPTISPFVYFKRPEDVTVSTASDASVPPTEA